MTIARITTPGLTAMGLSVAALWGCLIGERLTIQRATREQVQVLREMHLLRQRQRSQPADVTVPHHPRPVRPAES